MLFKVFVTTSNDNVYYFIHGVVVSSLRLGYMIVYDTAVIVLLLNGERYLNPPFTIVSVRMFFEI